MKYILIIILFLCSGCSIIWTDHILVATLGKDLSAWEVKLVVDANSLRIEAVDAQSETDDVTVIVPPGLIKTD